MEKIYDAKEVETQAFSKGIQAGMIQALSGIIGEYKKQGWRQVESAIKFCEDEIERLEKINAIGE